MYATIAKMRALKFLSLIIIVEILILSHFQKSSLVLRTNTTNKLAGSETELMVLAQDFFKKGNYPQAIEAYQMILKTTNNKENIYLQLANVYRYWGKYEESEQMFKKALDLNPSDFNYAGLA